MVLTSKIKSVVTGFSLLFVLFGISCNTVPDDSSSLNSKTGALETIMEEDEKDSPDQKISYTSALPCDSCEGLVTTLELFPHDNTYTLTSQHSKQHNKAISLSGTFNTERGFENDVDATLYILNDNAPDHEHLYFLRETGNADALIELDNNKHKSTKKKVLKKIPGTK